MLLYLVWHVGIQDAVTFHVNGVSTIIGCMGQDGVCRTPVVFAGENFLWLLDWNNVSLG